MKISLTVIALILSYLSLFSQNPIVREELFELNNNQWNKVSIVERSFDNQGALTTEQELYFETAFQKWVFRNKKWFDAAGNEVRTIRRFFRGLNLGFGVQDTRRTFNDKNQVLTEETYFQEDKNRPVFLTNRNEWEYLADCSIIVRFYRQDQATDAELYFHNLQFRLFDEDCKFVRFVFNDRDISVDRLRNQFRLSFESLENGKQRRIVETLTCPNEFGCDEWAIREQKIFDADGRLLYFENGSKEDFSRSITNFEYLPTQTIRTFQTFTRLSNSTRQLLESRTVIVRDTSDSILSILSASPLSFSETTFAYNNQGLVTQRFSENTRKNSTGIETFRDTTSFSYAYYCDDLLKTQTIDYGNDFKTKVEYSYLKPADCGEVTDEILPFNLFPNPATNVLNLTSEQFVNNTLSFSIIDAYGKVIYQQRNYRGINQVIAINAFPNGVYFLQLKSQDKIATKSFIIAR